MVRIIDYPKENLGYNNILLTTLMHFGFTTPWRAMPTFCDPNQKAEVDE